MSRSACDDESVDWRVIEPLNELNIEELLDVEIENILRKYVESAAGSK